MITALRDWWTSRKTRRAMAGLRQDLANMADISRRDAGYAARRILYNMGSDMSEDDRAYFESYADAERNMRDK